MGWLDGATVLVTGGGSGLGRALVQRFLLEGARVGVLERSAEKVEALPEGVVGIVGDATVWEDNLRAVEAVVDRFGQLDTLIANAGIWDYNRRLIDLEGVEIAEAFDEIFRVNVLGYLLAARAAAPHLVSSRGSIIMTLSNAAFQPAGGGPLYTATKHAGVGLVQQLAHELAPKVRVNGVAPGWLGSDLRGPSSLGQADRTMSSRKLPDVIRDITPLHVVPEADDYVGHYVLLASATGARTTTGSIIRCDGGLAVRGLGAVAGGEDL